MPIPRGIIPGGPDSVSFPGEVGKLTVDNILLDDNTISSVNTNGNIILSPNGSGSVNIANASISGGTINNTSIGATTPNSGKFTQITSTISTGTPPLVVSSTTKVANLNSALWDSISSDYFIKQVKNKLVSDIYNTVGASSSIVGFWLFDEVSGTTIYDKSSYGRNITISQDISNFSRDSAGGFSALNFNGSDKYFEIGDNDDFSFGNGTTDSAFSIVALCNPNTVSPDNYLLAKRDATSGQIKKEWFFGFISNTLWFGLVDNSIDLGLVRSTNTLSSHAGNYHSYISTYDGSSNINGLKIYIDSVRSDTTSSFSPSYIAMENTTAKVCSYTLDSGGNKINHTNGKYAFLAIIRKELSQNQVNEIDAIIRSYSNTISRYYKTIECIQTYGNGAINGSLSVDNVKIDGNTLNVTNTNGSLSLESLGTGNLNINAGSSGEIVCKGNAIPQADNTYKLGKSGAKWTEVWATNGTIQTSDKRNKTDITKSSLGLEFIRQLTPVSFRWTDGKRTHYGMIAQDVENILSGQDFAGFIRDKDTDEYGLRYSEFISPMIKAIQELDSQISNNQNEICFATLLALLYKKIIKFLLNK